MSESFRTETGNGIKSNQSGTLKKLGSTNKAVAVQSGTISWVSPEGIPITLSYVADETGFHPVGSHLPTSPPTPEVFLKPSLPALNIPYGTGSYDLPKAAAPPRNHVSEVQNMGEIIVSILLILSYRPFIGESALKLIEMAHNKGLQGTAGKTEAEDGGKNKIMRRPLSATNVSSSRSDEDKLNIRQGYQYSSSSYAPAESHTRVPFKRRPKPSRVDESSLAPAYPVLPASQYSSSSTVSQSRRHYRRPDYYSTTVTTSSIAPSGAGGYASPPLSTTTRTPFPLPSRRYNSANVPQLQEHTRRTPRPSNSKTAAAVPPQPPRRAPSRVAVKGKKKYQPYYASKQNETYGDNYMAIQTGYRPSSTSYTRIPPKTSSTSAPSSVVAPPSASQSTTVPILKPPFQTPEQQSEAAGMEAPSSGVKPGLPVPILKPSSGQTEEPITAISTPQLPSSALVPVLKPSFRPEQQQGPAEIEASPSPAIISHLPPFASVPILVQQLQKQAVQSSAGGPVVVATGSVSSTVDSEGKKHVEITSNGDRKQFQF